MSVHVRTFIHVCEVMQLSSAGPSLLGPRGKHCPRLRLLSLLPLMALKTLLLELVMRVQSLNTSYHYCVWVSSQSQVLLLPLPTLI